MVRWKTAPLLQRNKPMKLRKLHIEDYKMFKDFDISFVDENDEALPIVVLAGVNGSGKSSLFEFILSLLSSNSKALNFIDVFLNNQRNKEVRIYNAKNNIGFVPYRNDETYDKDIYRYKSFNEKYSGGLELFPSGIDETKKVAEEFVKTFYYFLKEKDFRPSEITEHFQKYMTDIFDDLDIGFKYSHLDKDDNVWFSNGDNEGYYYTGRDNGKNKNIFTIDELSTGEKTLLSKIMYLYFKDYNDKVILIDEPELSLHPSWQNKVLKIYENFAFKNNCQIIIATHSPHIIGSAKNEYLRFLRKGDKGNIEVVDNITAYGRDIEWILEEMGVTDTRLPKITKRFEEIQELINSEEFDKADDALDKLEYVIGENDKDILALRNDLAFERMDFEEDN